jgi:hypothetical protein
MMRVAGIDPIRGGVGAGLDRGGPGPGIEGPAWRPILPRAGRWRHGDSQPAVTDRDRGPDQAERAEGLEGHRGPCIATAGQPRRPRAEAHAGTIDPASGQPRRPRAARRYPDRQ